MGGAAIKCFCFIYKERDFRRPLLKEEGATSPSTTSSSKAKPRRRGKPEGSGDPKHPLGQLSPPTLSHLPQGPIWDKEVGMYTGEEAQAWVGGE